MSLRASVLRSISWPIDLWLSRRRTRNYLTDCNYFKTYRVQWSWRSLVGFFSFLRNSNEMNVKMFPSKGGSHHFWGQTNPLMTSVCTIEIIALAITDSIRITEIVCVRFLFVRKYGWLLPSNQEPPWKCSKFQSICHVDRSLTWYLSYGCWVS